MFDETAPKTESVSDADLTDRALKLLGDMSHRDEVVEVNGRVLDRQFAAAQGLTESSYMTETPLMGNGHEEWAQIGEGFRPLKSVDRRDAFAAQAAEAQDLIALVRDAEKTPGVPGAIAPDASVQYNTNDTYTLFTTEGEEEKEEK